LSVGELDHAVFSMSVQEAVEAPRFVTHSFAGSFEPHPYHLGRLDLERGIGAAAGEALLALGHRVEWLPDLSIGTAGVCAVVADRETAVLYGARIRVAPPAPWAGSLSGPPRRAVNVNVTPVEPV
jgi:gamma-glutamyltranspeptidase / glutathione hydrolase